MVAGNRILLSPAFTQEVLATRAPIHTWDVKQWQAAAEAGVINRTLPLRHVALGAAAQARRAPLATACAAAISASGRATSVASTASTRPSRAGATRTPISPCACSTPACGARRARFATGVLHLWHRENDRTREGINWDTLQERIADGTSRAAHGLDAYFGGQENAPPDVPLRSPLRGE